MNPTDKVVADVTAAFAAIPGGLKDGARIMAGGFGLSGNAEQCIAEIARLKPKGLTIISNNCGNQGKGLAILLQQRQVAQVICSYIGGNPDLEAQYLSGEIAVELSPQGTLAERIRAGGAGIGGFLTPTGVGTLVANGKETHELDGKTYLLEKPLRADLAIVRAAVGDPDGNLRFYRTSRNFNPLVATAADFTIAEVDRLVGRGELDADDIHLPGIYVDCIFEYTKHDNFIEHRTTRPRQGDPTP
ncbi:MAG: CoA transferase subunit A [Deltaproteobacteria bacterium]|nr:CoA transferase subunit A [Deltaproteobacteria bacterium]